ncbi:MAG: RNA polymerase sigma factor [Burkholderiaceae bacterium]|jgi:RNA polymerase sigma-70 factor (ECF subfamily)
MAFLQKLLTAVRPPTDHTSDWVRLRRATQGEVSAGLQVVQDLMPVAYRIAYRLLNDPHAAEDILQESFIRLWRAAPGTAATASVATYFNRIVINRCKTHLSQLRLTRGAHFDDNDAWDAEVSLNAAPDGPADFLENDQLAAAVAALPERQRLALSLWAYEDFSVADIAEFLSLPQNAVHQLLHRAKHNLRQRLTGLRHGT